MTKDDAIAQIKAISPLNADDIIGLQNCTPAQLQAILQNYIDGDPALDNPSIWKKITSILQQVPDWVQTAISIIQVLSKIFPV